MQIGVLFIFFFLYINYEAQGFEFDFVGKNSNTFADGTNDYVRSVGSRRDLSMSGGSVSSGGVIDRSAVPRRLIQPPPLKRSVNNDRILNLYRWMAYSAPVPDY